MSLSDEDRQTTTEGSDGSDVPDDRSLFGGSHDSHIQALRRHLVAVDVYRELMQTHARQECRQASEGTPWTPRL